MPSKHIMPELRELQNLLMQGNEEFLRQALTKMLNLMMQLEVEVSVKDSRTEGRETHTNKARRKRQKN